MENRHIEFGNVDANTTDIATLILSEFMLVYGNDWCVIPYEVGVGSVCEVVGTIVTDTFGELALQRPAGHGADDDWQRWTMFTLSTNREDGAADARLFMPPSLAKSMEGPLSRASCVSPRRDGEHGMGGRAHRSVPERKRRGWLRRGARRGATTCHDTAASDHGCRSLRAWQGYATELAPVYPGSRTGQRSIGPTPASADAARAPILGQILNVHDADRRYLINEEEIPRAGRIATRAVQRARWFDGRTFVWIGRRVSTGRGEGSSGLIFESDRAGRVVE